MISNKKTFIIGLMLMTSFIVVLMTMFFPFFEGKNILMFSDELYNSISKHSADYFSIVLPAVTEFDKNLIDVDIELKNAVQAKESIQLFAKSGAQVDNIGTVLKIRGDLGSILGNCLNDSQALYQNNDKVVSNKYGMPEKRTLYNWWASLVALDKALKEQNRFSEAKIVLEVKKKAVETAYNFYGITPLKITDRLGFVALTLLFYVFYTLWYGFAILFLFEGCGLNLKH